MHSFLCVYRESMATTATAPMNCVLFNGKKSVVESRPINNFSHLFFSSYSCCENSTPHCHCCCSLNGVSPRTTSRYSHIFPVACSFFLLLLGRLKLRLMTNFVKLVLKCYQLMAILNESNYYYQQQNGRAWTKRCATHCRCLFYAIDRSLT